ncbi:hypothetical protein Dda_4643 [Drechslerella dactyloides]|uniref:Uncharacterized protein n=1 Tax=Drechslerella dactyloides TaxID=74499 RepID=A0AAD6IY28_DREDA|nr:hypothetical protein Dda_4643 [Drechslerella dactyloides]
MVAMKVSYRPAAKEDEGEGDDGDDDEEEKERKEVGLGNGGKMRRTASGTYIYRYMALHEHSYEKPGRIGRREKKRRDRRTAKEKAADRHRNVSSVSRNRKEEGGGRGQTRGGRWQ